MSNRDGRRSDKKKRDQYAKGKLCPKCGKGKFMGCDQQHKEDHRHHVVCSVCKCCNF